MEGPATDPRVAARVAGSGLCLGLVVALAAVAVVGSPTVTTGTPGQQAIGGGAFQTGLTANFTVTPNPAHPGEEVVLDARNSTVPDGSIAYCEFDVDGDGTYDERRDDCLATYPYDASGEYDLRVRVTGTGEQTATATVELLVRANEPPRPTITLQPPDPSPGQTVTLSAGNSTDPDGTVDGFTWRVDGAEFSGEAVATGFDQPGNYSVSLTATDDDGASATARTTVAVRPNEAPTASLSVDASGATVGEPVRLDATGSTDPDGRIRLYAWDLDGDGTIDRRTSTGTTTVRPPADGALAPRVTVSDDRNASDTAVTRFTVAPADGSGGSGPVDGSAGGGSDGIGVVGPGVVPVVPAVLVAVLLLALLGAAGVAVRRRATVATYVERLRALLARGDVRRRLAKKVTGTTVKKLAKQAIRRFSDLVEGGGEIVGEGFERVGRAIKRGSRRVAAWLRRLGS